MANTDVVTCEKKAVAYSKEATTWLQSEVANNLLKAPKDYDLGSEVSLALLKVAEVRDKSGNLALDVCTKASVFSALKQMSLCGLSMAKNQCYPIVYGDKLQIMRSYFGTVAQLERMFPDYKITANVIFKGDSYDYVFNEDTSCYEIQNLKSSLANRDNELEGAFGTIKDKRTGVVIFSEVMSMKEIRTSWSHAKTNKVQQEFPQEMAKRTLINRMAKMFVNKSRGVDATVVEAYNAMTESEYDNTDNTTPINESKEKAIREKSQGNRGLSALLKKTSTEAPMDVEPKTIPTTEENSVGPSRNASDEELDMDEYEEDSLASLDKLADEVF